MFKMSQIFICKDCKEQNKLYFPRWIICYFSSFQLTETNINSIYFLIVSHALSVILVRFYFQFPRVLNVAPLIDSTIISYFAMFVSDFSSISVLLFFCNTIYPFSRNNFTLTVMTNISCAPRWGKIFSALSMLLLYSSLYMMSLSSSLLKLPLAIYLFFRFRLSYIIFVHLTHYSIFTL